MGTGQSTNRDARTAGREAARAALQQLQASAGVVFVFGTAGHDQGQLLAGVRDIAGTAPVSGCSTSGIITTGGSDEGTHAVAAMAVACDWLTFEALSAGPLSGDPRGCARRLAAQARSLGEGRMMAVFPDGLTGDVSQFVEALREELPRKVVIAGGTAGELLRTQRTWQYCGAQARSDTVSAVLIGGDVAAEVAVSHACEPVGSDQIVTRAKDGWIFEIDGRRAWDVYREYLDAGDLTQPTMSHFCYLCLAVPLPAPDALYGDYAIRCPLRLDAQTGALFFPGNIASGTRVRMALRDAELTMQRLKSSIEPMVARHPTTRPAFVLQFDCCCRGRLMFGERAFERCLGPTQRFVGAGVPWLGLHTYGEIGPLAGGEALFHNYATVLCALYPTTRQGEDDVFRAATRARAAATRESHPQ